MPKVAWAKHQNPNVWRDLLRERGLGDFSLSWYVPFELRHLRPLLDNRFAGWLRSSYFVLRSRRPSESPPAQAAVLRPMEAPAG